MKKKNKANRDSGGARAPERVRPKSWSKITRPAAPGARLLTFDQMSEIYGPPATTWRTLAADELNGITVVRIGRRIWVERETVERFLDANREAARP